MNTLKSKDTLRLQGFKQFRWKRRQTWISLKARLKELKEKITLWSRSLNEIEGYHGTGVLSFFLFIKWLIFLNIVISLIIFTLVIYPTIITKDDNNERQNDSTNNSSILAETLPMLNQILLLLRGKGWLNQTPLYYAYYENRILDLHYFHYYLPLVYISTAFLYYLYSFIMILKNAANGVKDRLLEKEGQFYTFCNIIFCGWDFCIRSQTSADIKHKALYNEITGRLNMERRKEESRNRTKTDSFRLFLVRFVVNITVLALLSLAGIVILISSNYLSNNNQNIIYNSQGKSGFVSNELLQLIFGYIPAGFIVAFNIILPIIFQRLGGFEDFDPLFTMQVAVFRTILLRYSSLCVLLVSFYRQAVSFTPECWENTIAEELYKLLMLNVVTDILLTFVFNLPRSLIAAHTSNKFCQFVGKQEFHLPKHVLDVVYIQTIIWLGAFYAPLLPSLGVVIFFLLFYVKKFTCMVNCDPATKVYYASKSHSLYMFILLFSFAFSIVPWAFSVAEITPCKKSGPFHEFNTTWSAVNGSFSKLPQWLQNSMEFCTGATFVVPLFILLTLANYYYYNVYTANKQMVAVLKRHLVLEGHDKQFLLNRLSAFIRQQQKYYKPINTEL